MTDVIKCPKCGGKLENGYIHAPRGIYWDSIEHKWHVLSSETLLSMWTSTMPRVRGWKCNKCKLVIFLY